jgi:hypothetical protein
MLRLLMLTALLCTMVNHALAQTPLSNTAACAFHDGKELSVRYNNDEATPSKAELPDGEIGRPAERQCFFLLMSHSRLATQKYQWVRTACTSFRRKKAGRKSKRAYAILLNCFRGPMYDFIGRWRDLRTGSNGTEQ